MKIFVLYIKQNILPKRVITQFFSIPAKLEIVFFSISLQKVSVSAFNFVFMKFFCTAMMIFLGSAWSFKLSCISLGLLNQNCHPFNFMLLRDNPVPYITWPNRKKCFWKEDAILLFIKFLFYKKNLWSISDKSE